MIRTKSKEQNHLWSESYTPILKVRARHGAEQVILPWRTGAKELKYSNIFGPKRVSSHREASWNHGL